MSLAKRGEFVIVMKQGNEAKQIRVSIPTECHLWKTEAITRDELHALLVLVRTYEDDSHLMRNLLKCKECGHLYFHEFYEIVDWDAGNDAQYSKWIPVDDAGSADALNGLSPFELLQYDSIRIDFPSNADKPTGPHWNRRGPSAQATNPQ